MLVVAALGLGLSGIAPPAEAAAGADCGTGRDSPPTITMASGGTCAGTHNGEPQPTYPQPWVDFYDVAVTDADHLAVGFSGSCDYSHAQVSGSFEGWPATGYVAQGDGHATITVRSPYWTFDGGSSCASQNTDYTVSVLVTANDRPVIDSFDFPSEALVGIPYDLQVAASDIDGNLDTLGLSSACCGDPEVEVSGGSASSATIAVTFLETGSVRAVATDAFGAHAIGPAWSVTAVEDDCGTGGDIATFDLGFDTVCRAYLAASLSDTSDTFTVDVAAGVARGRVLVDEVTSGMTTGVTVQSPSGATVAVDAQGVFDISEPGQWAVTVARTGWKDGAYDITVLPLPDPMAPTLDVTLTPTPSPHVGQTVTLAMTATDPSGLPVRYEVDWGDGTTRSVPSTGVAPSGQVQSAEHFYWDTDPATITVTAHNADGLSASWSQAVTPRIDWDRCSTGDGDDRDAPNHNADWDGGDHNASFAARDALACDGTLGFSIPSDRCSTTCLYGDNGDLYRIRACTLGASPCHLGAGGVRESALGQIEVTVTTSADLAVRVTIGSTDYGTVPAGSTRTVRTGNRITLASSTNVWLRPVGSSRGDYRLEATVHPAIVVAAPSP